MREELIVFDDDGNALDESVSTLVYEDFEKEEINNSINILKKYNLYIEPEKYYKIIDDKNKINSKFDKLYDVASLSGILGTLWSLGILHYAYSNDYNISIMIFLVMITFVNLAYSSANITQEKNHR